MPEMTEKQMIEDQKGWPHWPMLPLKKRNPNGGWPTLRVLLATEPNDPVVLYEFNPWEPPVKADNPNRLDLEKVESLKREQFATVDELLADGWVVD